MPAPRLFGPRRRPLAQLTDEELLQEVQVRRQRRTTIAGRQAPPEAGETLEASKPTVAQSDNSREVRQWLANLELPANAGLQDVERAFDTLRAKYEPIAQGPDGKRAATARLLLSSLRTAYEKLRTHLESQRR